MTNTTEFREILVSFLKGSKCKLYVMAVGVVPVEM